MDFGKATEEWSTVRIWWDSMVFGCVIYLVGVVKIIKGGENIISDGLSWVSIEFLVCGGVSKFSSILLM